MENPDTIADVKEITQNVNGKQFFASNDMQQGEITPCLKKQNSSPSLLSKPKPKVPLKPPVAKKPSALPNSSSTDLPGDPLPEKRKPPPPLPRTPPKGSGKPPPPKPRTAGPSRKNSQQNASLEKCDNGDKKTESIGTYFSSNGENEKLTEVENTEKCSTNHAQSEETLHLAQDVNHDAKLSVQDLDQCQPTSTTLHHPSEHSPRIAIKNHSTQSSNSSLQPVEKNSPNQPKVSPKVAPKPQGPRQATKLPHNGQNATSNTDLNKKKSDDFLHDSFNVTLGQSTFYVPNSGKNASESVNDSNKCELNSSSEKSLKPSGSNTTLTSEGAILKVQPRNKTSSNWKEECVTSCTSNTTERTAHFNVSTSKVHIDHSSKLHQKGAQRSIQTTKEEVDNNTSSSYVLNNKDECPVPATFIKDNILTSDTMKSSANSDINKNTRAAGDAFEQQSHENVNNLTKCAKENSEVVKLRPKPQKRSPGKPRPLPRKRSSLCKQAGLDVEDGRLSEISLSETSSIANSVESIPNVVNVNFELLPADSDEKLSINTNTDSLSACAIIDKDKSPGHDLSVSSRSQNLQKSNFGTKESSASIHKHNGKLSSVLCNKKENSDGCDKEKQLSSNMTENISVCSTNRGLSQNLSARNFVLQENNNSNAEDAERVCDSVNSSSQRSGTSDELPIVETSSLLDEMEKIISRRMSELGSKFSTGTSQSERSSLESDNPIPPIRHKKNRLKSQSTQFLTRSLDSSDFGGSNLSINSDSGIIIPPAVSKRICPPKPKRNKLANRSVSDVGCLRSRSLQSRDEIDVDLVDKSSLETGMKVVPPTLPRRQRSITVDFCVPANQHALLREIALADHRKGLSNQESSVRDASLERRKPRPTRKAPPPPKKITSDNSDKKDTCGKVQMEKDQVVPNVNERLTDLNNRDYDGISSDEHDHEYLEIPESFIHQHSLNSSTSTEGSSMLSSGDQMLPVPPELPPRNSMSPQNSVDSVSPRFSGISPLASEMGSSTSDLHSRHDRPLSRVSTSSVLSSNSENGSVGHFDNNELSTSESDDEDHEDKVARKKEKKVFYIAREIWSSEKVFVGVLKLLCEDFRTHILESKDPNGKPVIQEEVLNKILNYLPQLYNLNQVLLQDLEGRINNWDKCKQIADIFVKKGAFLKLYTSYIRDFSETNEILDEACKRHPPFQNAVRAFEMSAVCASLTLKHYMLKPIQRIPQYQLLLQDYLKNLPRESPDYNDTLAALTIVREVADHANESMKQGDQVQKMLEIQKSLDGNFEVIKPGRILLKEGELMKLSRKEMQPRMFFLFNDVLLYTTPTTSGGYRLNNALTLNGMKVIKASLDEFKSEFDIITVTRSFTVEARTIKERDDWVTALQNAISENAQRKKTFDTKVDNQSIYNIDYELGSKAPIWIPDTRVTMCMICTCEFSVTWRRHHCRACGRVLCSNCSDNKAPLEYLRNKPARVCDECFSQLKTNLSEKAVEGKKRTSSLTDSVTHDTDGSLLSLGGLLERFQQIRKSSRFTPKFNIRRPARLKEVHANDTGSSISGYLKILKGKKWKKFWFVLKDKVLYTYKASNDMAAVESMPVVGYVVGTVNQIHEGCKPSVMFQLIHKNRPAIIFQAEDEEANNRWIAAMEDASKA